MPDSYYNLFMVIIRVNVQIIKFLAKNFKYDQKQWFSYLYLKTSFVNLKK